MVQTSPYGRGQPEPGGSPSKPLPDTRGQQVSVQHVMMGHTKYRKHR